MPAVYTDTRAARDMNFVLLKTSALTKWVVSNPGHTEDRDSRGNTPLWAAARRGSCALVSHLVNSRGADVNGRTSNGSGAIHHASSADVLGLLLDGGAQPVIWNDKGWTPLMHHVRAGRSECVARLLKDSRVRGSMNSVAQGGEFDGFSGLHLACCSNNITPKAKLAILRSLLTVGANPTLPNRDGLNCLQILREYLPIEPLELILLEEAMDAQRAVFLIKARQMAIASRTGMSEAGKCVKQGKVERGRALPSIASGMEGKEGDELGFGVLVAFVGGVELKERGHGMPRDVFMVVMDMLIPSWHPLRNAMRRKDIG